MKKDLVYLLIVISLFACDKAFEEQVVVYHVIKKPAIDQSGSAPPPPPPPALFYGHHNFIVSTDGKTYYHNKFKDYGWCGTGIDGTRPDFLNLRPSDLKDVSANNFERFINNTVQDTSSFHKRIFASISSPTDTITNKQFQVITELFRRKGFRFYTIRRTTEEEQVVLESKIKNKNYNPDSVDWKVGFGDEKFLPPNSEE